jgi:16S rRNA (uracil1498-N3)-methyltransferase
MSRHRTRFFIDSSHVNENRAVISGSDAIHIVKVLRLKAGDVVRVICGGVSHIARIDKASPDAVECLLLKDEAGRWMGRVKVTLAQALPKGKCMDQIVRKSTELGVARVVPLETERCVSRLNGDKAEQRLQRWRKIAAEAAKQCSRMTIPEIKPLQTLPEFLLNGTARGLKLMLYEEEKRVGLRHILSGDKKADTVNLLVGAEGGFSPEEVENARRSGYTTVSMGPRILRTDTASLALLSVVMYELEEMEPFAFNLR